MNCRAGPYWRTNVASTIAWQWEAPGLAWWYVYVVIEPDAVAVNDFAAANIGQVKNVFSFDLPE